MIGQTLASWWGAKAFRTGETNPFDPEAPEHREFVGGRMAARELAAAQAALTLGQGPQLENAA